MESIKNVLALAVIYFVGVFLFVVLVTVCVLLLYDFGGLTLAELMGDGWKIFRLALAIVIFFLGAGFIIVVEFRLVYWLIEHFI